MYESKGEVIFIGEEIQVTEKFKKREFTIRTTSDNYPQELLFQLVQDKTFIADKMNVGSQVTVFFNLKGRGFKNAAGETAWRNNSEAWKIDIEPVSSTPAKVEQDDLPY